MNYCASIHWFIQCRTHMPGQISCGRSSIVFTQILFLLYTYSIKERQRTFIVTQWRIRVIVLHWKHNSVLMCVCMCVHACVCVCVCVCVVVELHATVNCMKILIVAQSYISSKFLSPATMRILPTPFQKRSQNCEKRLLASSCLTVCLSLRPPELKTSAPTRQIFIKFDI